MPLGGVKRLYVMAAWKYRPRLASKWVREIAPTAERQVFWTQTNQMLRFLLVTGSRADR